MSNPDDNKFDKNEKVQPKFKIKLDMKRFITYNLFALFLAIGANFVGMTSFFMTSTNPEYFRSLKLDQLYSIGGFNRYIDNDDKYEVMYPNNWIIDQNVLIAKEMKREKPLNLYGQSLMESKTPSVAFSNPLSKGKENLSVLKSQVMSGFTVDGTLGTPEEAAPKLMEIIAPASSGKTYTLINAYKRDDININKLQDNSNSIYYVIEYRIEKSSNNLNQHCISVITSRNQRNSLFTLTAMAPEPTWTINSQKITTIANSFHLL